MQIKIAASKLSGQLQRVRRAVARGNRALGLPILGHVLLEGEGDKLTISGTDIEVGIVVTMPAQVAAAGAVAVPHKAITNAVAGQRGQTLTLTSTGLDVQLASSETEMLAGMDAGEFPIIAQPQLDRVLATFAASNLTDTLTATLFSSAVAGTDSYLERYSRVVFEFDQPGEVLVETSDGFRIASDRLAYQSGNLDVAATRLLFPTAALTTLKALLPTNRAAEVPVTLSLHPRSSWAIFEWTAADITTRLTVYLAEGCRPNTEFIPQQPGSTCVRLNVAAAAAALQAVTAGMGKNDNTVRLVLDSATGTATAAAWPPREDVTPPLLPTLTVAGANLRVGFDIYYLLDMLAALRKLGLVEITVDLNGPTDPGVFRSPNRPNFTHLIMPHHLPSSWGANLPGLLSPTPCQLQRQGVDCCRLRLKPHRCYGSRP